MAVRSKIERAAKHRGAETRIPAAVSPRQLARANAIKSLPSESCPYCGGKTLDREHRHGILDHVFRIVRLCPYRCRRCYHRFYRRAF
jgi:hypothetical protein